MRKGKAREDPQHLELPLGSHPLEIPIEIGEIAADWQPLGAGLLPIADRPIDDAFLVPSDVGVAQERDEIVGDRAVDRVLKIENSRAGLADHEVARVVVTVHEHPRLREVVIEDRRKRFLQRLELCRVELAAQLARYVPVGEEAKLLLEQFPAVIGQQSGTAQQLDTQQRG